MKLQQLLEATFPSPEWIISDMVPAGLVLLGGKPKQGKSWLALQMALAVSTGSPIFDRYHTYAGHVLYLALEDTLQRLQDRTRRLLSTMIAQPTGLELAVHWPRLDQGGLSQLEAYVEQHPHLRLIVIDTWGKVAPQPSARTRTQYEEDYASVAPLKQLAETHVKHSMRPPKPLEKRTRRKTRVH